MSIGVKYERRPGSTSANLAAVLAVAVFLIAGGCATNKVLVAEQAARIDSLVAANDFLANELSVYRDSIAFYDFIDSGEFDQELRFKNSEINRLEFTLAVCRDGGSSLSLELVDDLFAPASAQLTRAGEARLDVLADTVRYHADGGLINIEGHSDATVPVGELARRYPTNWELSAARASAVARYFVDKHELDAALFRVVSYGASRPVASNSSPRGRRLNRRIRIAFVPGSGN
ncbi:MAG: OmpA family protein [Rhodothermales bacterium]|nr:OmpA family protein [Rhodothermales bacterium]